MAPCFCSWLFKVATGAFFSVLVSSVQNLSQLINAKWFEILTWVCVFSHRFQTMLTIWLKAIPLRPLVASVSVFGSSS